MKNQPHHRTFKAGRIVRRALGALLCLGVPAWAQPAPAPATPAASANGAMAIVIADVAGNVQVRPDPNATWKKAEKGMAVAQSAQFRTGPRSSVTCVIAPDQTFTLDRLGIASVAQAMKSGTKVTTEMLMKYGRMNYSIEAAGLEHESTIVSPSSTLAVRGTVVSLYDQPPFAPEATSFTGRAMFRDISRLATVAVGSKNGKKSTVTAGKTSAAATALGDTVVDPRLGGKALTASDQTLIAQQVARGGILSFDSFANIPVVRNAPPLSDAELVKGLPGALNFVIRWDGPADINLEVFVEKGDPLNVLIQGFRPTEFLYPGFGTNKTADGGSIAFDHRGGPKGGTEIASFPTAPKAAAYGIAALDISGKPVKVTIDAFLNGQKGQLFFLQDNDPKKFRIANEEVGTVMKRGDFLTANFTIPELFPGASAVATPASKRKRHTPAVASPAPVTPTTPAVTSRRTGR